MYTLTVWSGKKNKQKRWWSYLIPLVSLLKLNNFLRWQTIECSPHFGHHTDNNSPWMLCRGRVKKKKPQQTTTERKPFFTITASKERISFRLTTYFKSSLDLNRLYQNYPESVGYTKRGDQHWHDIFFLDHNGWTTHTTHLWGERKRNLRRWRILVS